MLRCSTMMRGAGAGGSARPPGSHYSKWPWPVQLPLKKGAWFHHLNRFESLSQEARSVGLLGDLAVATVLLWSAYRVYYQFSVTNEHQTRLKHLTGHPPAIIAQDFDFSAASTSSESEKKNRTVSRKTLDAYRTEFAATRASGASIESFIFKY